MNLKIEDRGRGCRLHVNQEDAEDTVEEEGNADGEEDAVSVEADGGGFFSAEGTVAAVDAALGLQAQKQAYGGKRADEKEYYYALNRPENEGQKYYEYDDTKAYNGRAAEWVGFILCESMVAMAVRHRSEIGN